MTTTYEDECSDEKGEFEDLHLQVAIISCIRDP